MSRLGIHTLLALAGASLVIACSVTSAAAEMDNCGQRLPELQCQLQPIRRRKQHAWRVQKPMRSYTYGV